MSKQVTKMRGGNKGLTVRVNLFALEEYREDFNAESARLWIKGSVTNADSKEKKMFNDAPLGLYAIPILEPRARTQPERPMPTSSTTKSIFSCSEKDSGKPCRL